MPTCASPFLNGVLRSSWGFSGYITSDTGAVKDIYSAHKCVRLAGSARAACHNLQCAREQLVRSCVIMREVILQYSHASVTIQKLKHTGTEETLGWDVCCCLPAHARN